MDGYQRPSIASSFRFSKAIAPPAQKKVPVAIVVQ